MIKMENKSPWQHKLVLVKSGSPGIHDLHAKDNPEKKVATKNKIFLKSL
jgi:hypothetical protein